MRTDYPSSQVVFFNAIALWQNEDTINVYIEHTNYIFQAKNKFIVLHQFWNTTYEWYTGYTGLYMHCTNYTLPNIQRLHCSAVVQWTLSAEK